MKKAFTLILLIGVLSACTSKFAKIQKSKDYQYKLKMAEQYYAKKKYNFAQQLFEDVFPYLKGTPQFEDIYYKFAYCSYYEKDYVNAENLFKVVKPILEETAFIKGAIAHLRFGGLNRIEAPEIEVLI